MNQDLHERALVDNGEGTSTSRSAGMAATIEENNFFSMMSSQLPALNRPLHSVDNDPPNIRPVDDEEDTAKILIDKLPESATNIDVVDSLIANQMMKLSVEEREKAYMDLHAVKSDLIETKEAINAGLDSLNYEIEKLQDKHAYDLAWSMNSKYVENPSFRLAFLRADSFDARKAALRIARHFQVKLDLFGENKLVMEIVQDDLDREAMEAMYCGRGQWLDAKDRAGRRIIVIFFDDQFSTEAMLQRAFYLAMTCIRNEDAQIHGFVGVVFALARRPSQRDTGTVKHFNFTRSADGLPARFESIHFCQYGEIAQELFAVSKSAMPAKIKTRTRTHHGTHDEIMSSLAGFGIAPGSIPVADGCKITNLEAHHQYLVDLRTAERLTQPRRHRINLPSKFDILFGKGTPFQKHPGNVQLRSLVTEQYKIYEKAEKGEKSQISQEIVRAMQQSAGLFLRPDGDAWVCVEDDVARQKVSALFRSVRLRFGEK